MCIWNCACCPSRAGADGCRIARLLRFVLTADGSMTSPDGKEVTATVIDDRFIDVPHLRPHVMQVPLPKGDTIGIKLVYSSHCWSARYDQALHGAPACLMMDGAVARIFDAERFRLSQILPDMLSDLASHRLYWTPADRNYGVYNASALIDGVAYTAFFTLKKDRGKIGGCRHSLVMRIESAYRAPQPSKGMRIKFAAAIDHALRGSKPKYR